MIRIVRDTEYHSGRGCNAITVEPREAWEMIAGFIASGAENVTKPSDYHLKFRLVEDKIVRMLDASGPKDEMKFIEDRIAALYAPAKKISVSADALYKVLNALQGHGHEIRELQFTRGLNGLAGFENNPIDVLVKEWNEFTNK